MDPFDKAIAAIELRDPKEKLVYQDYADFFGVSRTTLARRHQGRQGANSQNLQLDKTHTTTRGGACTLH